jgi:hypothetical protein
VLGPDFDLVRFSAFWCAFRNNDIGGGKDFERPDSIEQRDTRTSENSHVPWF